MKPAATNDPRLMDGARVADAILDATADHARRLSELTGTRPCLAAVLVGDDPASVTYVKMKQSRARKFGIDSRLVELPAESITDQVVAAVRDLSDDPTVHGILVQHPVPKQIDERAVFEAIAAAKDVDGVTMHSFAAMAFGMPTLACATAGILRLLDAYEVYLEGLHAVVIGRTPILGKPVGMLLLARNATVTYCTLARRTCLKLSPPPTWSSPRLVFLASFEATGSSRAPSSSTPATTLGTSATSPLTRRLRGQASSRPSLVGLADDDRSPA
jgi:5,10-methylene-tetrahydrofolate dehydrogenase/methenyl tetrahydrofolate cyclohydrolase